MYKKYNSEANKLSPSFARRSLGVDGLLERLTPLLIVAATFIWLWR